MPLTTAPWSLYRSWNDYNLLETIVEHNQKIQFSPQKANRSPQNVVQMYPNSYQFVKNDYAEKEEEGQEAPSQQLKKSHLNIKEKMNKISVVI